MSKKTRKTRNQTGKTATRSRDEKIGNTGNGCDEERE